MRLPKAVQVFSASFINPMVRDSYISGAWCVLSRDMHLSHLMSKIFTKKKKKTKKNSGVHPRVSTLIQPSFQKKQNCHDEEPILR